VAVIEQIIKIRIYPYKTVEKMTEDVQGLAQVPLFNIPQILGLQYVGPDEFVDQALHRQAIKSLRLEDLIEKSRIETGAGFAFDSLDTVIYHQRSQVEKFMHLIAAVLKRVAGQQYFMLGYLSHRSLWFMG